ncbi:MAG: hypothetical protein IK066_06370 [Kiritimatiellae bacterium]|nr:hypothetical protein [Kiritimatiellia bacterium]
MPEWSEETRQRLFQSARGLTGLFWTTLAGMGGLMIVGRDRLDGWWALAVGCAYALPLVVGLWTLGRAMAGMRRSDGYALFGAVSVALLGLGPFWTFWRTAPDSGYFAGCAAGWLAAWVVWLSLACWLTRRYAVDLGDRALVSEATMAAGLTALFGAGVAGLVTVTLRNQGVPIETATMLAAARRLFQESRLVVFFPFLLTAYTLWLGKEAGYKRLMGGRDRDGGEARWN